MAHAQMHPKNNIASDNKYAVAPIPTPGFAVQERPRPLPNPFNRLRENVALHPTVTEAQGIQRLCRNSTAAYRTGIRTCATAVEQ